MNEPPLSTMDTRRLIGELAGRPPVSSVTLHAYVRKGMPSAKIAGRRIFRREAVERWLTVERGSAL